MAGATVDFKSFKKVVKFITETRYPVLLRGAHGIGKSEVVYQYAKEEGLTVVERRASQMTEGDLVGLPVLNGNRTAWNPPDWFKQACEEPVVLFLDEIDRATPEVRQGIFELTDSRKMNGNHLHKDTLVFAAVNGGEHGAQYQVGDMDPAELDRWTVFDIEPSIADWLEWASKDDNVEETVIDFIRLHNEHLEETKAFNPNQVYPSRRSWKRFSDVLRRTDLLTSQGVELYNLAASFIGSDTAFAFRSFVVEHKKVILPAEIIDEGKLKLLENIGINDHSALVEKMKDEKWFAKKLKKKQINNLAAYVFTAPSEVAVKFWQHFAIGPVENVRNVHNVRNADGVAIGVYMANMHRDIEVEKKEE